jgi:hypothetical protein
VREDLPIAGYLALLGLYEGALAGFVRWWKKKGRALPERPALEDLALVGIATHKLTRILTKERVTRPLRAPFTDVKSPPGAHLEEAPAGRGMRRAIGQLLTCPYCAGPWVAALFLVGLTARPREARWTAGLFSAVALSDWLHRAWRYLDTRTERMRSPSTSERTTSIPSSTWPNTV